MPVSFREFFPSPCKPSCIFCLIFPGESGTPSGNSLLLRCSCGSSPFLSEAPQSHFASCLTCPGSPPNVSTPMLYVTE